MSEADNVRTLLKKDPLLLSQILWARANVIARPLPKTAVRKRIGDVVYEFDFTDASLLDSFQHSQPAMKAMLYNSYEPMLLKTLRLFLKPGGTFIDIGANIGYISAVGASLVGKTGQVHSFEPVPRYFRRLQRLAELNPDFGFHPNPYAIGAENGTAVINLVENNIGGNSLVHALHQPHQVVESVEVLVRPLSEYLTEQGIERPSLLKIDVEGFEYRVLQGMAEYFAATDYRPPIICEVSVSAGAALGYTMADLTDYMARLGYTPYKLIGQGSRLNLSEIEEFANVLFLT